MTFRVTSKRYRQGTSFAIGTIIDGYLEDKEAEKVYARWKEDWPEPLGFPGGQQGITFEMIREIPQTKLNRTFGKVLGTILTHYAAEYGD